MIKHHNNTSLLKRKESLKQTLHVSTVNKYLVSIPKTKVYINTMQPKSVKNCFTFFHLLVPSSTEDHNWKKLWPVKVLHKIPVNAVLLMPLILFTVYIYWIYLAPQDQHLNLPCIPSVCSQYKKYSGPMPWTGVYCLYWMPWSCMWPDYFKLLYDYKFLHVNWYWIGLYTVSESN